MGGGEQSVAPAGPLLMTASPAPRLLEHVFCEYHLDFVRFVSQRCGIPDDEAEDLVQDMYVRFPNLVEKGGLDPEEDVDLVRLVRYLYGFLRRDAANRRRKARRRREALKGRDPLERSTDPTPRLLARLIYPEVLDRIGSEDARLLRWRYLDDLPYREIGERVGISAGAARVRVHRVLKRLVQVDINTMT